jgi:biotin carboxylase
MNIKPEAILYVDVDETADTRYHYREPHFSAARKRGLLCLTAGLVGRQHIERIQEDSDALFWVEQLDEPALLRLLNELEADYAIRAVFCHAGHAAQSGHIGQIVARVCRELGLPFALPEAIERCNNKFLMRKTLQGSGVRSVRHGLGSNEATLFQQAEYVRYPLIAKPPFGAGSAFVKTCRSWLELREHYSAFQKGYQDGVAVDFYGISHDVAYLGQIYPYIPGQTLLLEEYIEGIEGSVECVVTDRVSYPVLINEKLILTEKNDTVLENLLITPPVSFSVADIEAIRQYAQDCIAALELTHAIVHLEFRLTSSGPVVIEVNPRLGGLYVNAAFREIAGIDPYALYLSMLLGDDVDNEVELGCARASTRLQHYAMLALYPEKSGVLKGFEGIAELKKLPEIVDFSAYPENRRVSADSEECFIVKCWAKVSGGEDARRLYREIAESVKPVIDSQDCKVTNKQIANLLQLQHYYHIPEFGKLLRYQDDEAEFFRGYWNRLVLDQNFKDYTHRERRILRYFYHRDSGFLINRNTKYEAGVIHSVNYVHGTNHLTYAEDDFICNPLFGEILKTDMALLELPWDSGCYYSIDVHLFRIKAEVGQISPTTSGPHQDGRDWVVMHFIDGQNIHPVISEIHLEASSQQPVFRIPMNDFMETLIVNDRKVFHGASAVKPLRPDCAATRDLLLVTFTQSDHAPDGLAHAEPMA